LRQCAGRSTMPGIAAGNSVSGCGRLIYGSKAQESFPDGNDRSKAGVLHQRRLSRGKVSDSSIAQPAAVGMYVDSLSYRELRSGLLNISPERQPVRRHGSRIDDAPTVILKRSQISGIAGVNIQSDLKGVPALGRKVDNPAKFVNLEPKACAFVLKRPIRPAPTRYRRE